MKNNIGIIPQNEERINTDITPYVASKEQVISTVRELHPKFDGDLYDKCADEDYGVCIRRDAARLVVGKFVARSDRKMCDHKWKKRITCRLPDAEYDAIKDAMDAAGFTTMQEYVRFVLKTYAGLNNDDC